jgi:hypothetical protein
VSPCEKAEPFRAQPFRFLAVFLAAAFLVVVFLVVIPAGNLLSARTWHFFVGADSL